MDVNEQKNSQEYTNQNALLNKGEEILKDKAKKAIMKKVVTAAAIKVVSMTLMICAVSIIVSILIAGICDLLGINQEGKVNDAKSKAISTAYSPNASTTKIDENGNTVNKVIVTPNSYNNGYKIEYNNDPKNLEDAKEKIEEQTLISSTEFSDFEIGVMDALIDNGADLQYYTEEQLHCLLPFLKAEAATQNLDLRPNSEKQPGKTTGDYIDNYEPKKIEDLSENEVPGVILVQRTNTNSTTPITLEYKVLSDFEDLVGNNDPNAMNYFTLDEEGNLLIAKWEHVLITVDGEYPDNLAESERDVPTGEGGRYIIDVEPIAYSQYISKYTMPFEFLLQLLIITDEPEFCMELVNYVLDSKIVINIQEEQTVTVTDEEKVYTVHSKENKNINYKVDAAGQEIVKEDNYFLKYAMDDEELIKENKQNNCTNYSSEVLTVNVHKEHTTHSYSFRVTEADTWIAYYRENYSQPTVTTHPTTSNTIESKGQYEQVELEVPQPITNAETINNDQDVNRFITEIKNNYEPKIIVPSVSISDVVADENGNGYRTINVRYSNGVTKEYKKCEEVIDEQGRRTGEYNLPQTITVTTDKVAATDKTKEIPQINYTFKLESYSARGVTVYKYNLQTNTDPLVNCTVSSLNIEKFAKLDLNNTIKTTITEYKTNSNPMVEKGYYAIDSNGNFEKFLVAYDNSSGAQNQLNSIDSWLYDMMEEREITIEFIDTLKYLLYKYDGVDRGVTELEIGLFDSTEFVTISNGTGWWWPIGGSSTQDVNGKKYSTGEPVYTVINSGVGPRWGSNHGGVDIPGARNTNVIAAKSGTIITVVDEYGDGYYGFGGDTSKSYGNYIKIQHDDGTYSLYAHLEKGTIRVSQGDTVEQGQLLGGMGTSGSSTGPHLHFEIRDANNNRLDPEEYIDPTNTRPTISSTALRDWLWKMEGGTQNINGNIWTVFDPEGPDDTMNLAHGMVIATTNGGDSWYPELIPSPVRVGQTVTEEIAYKVWEKKIKGFNDAIDSACVKYGVTLTAYQKDALVSYIYRVGYGVGQNNSIVSAYANGGNAGLWDYMKNGYDKREIYEVGTKNRVAEEYELFVKGDYNYNYNGTSKYDQYCKNPNI